MRAIEQAITSATISTELANRLLNLAEFMEREDKPLPIDNRTLGEYAMKFRAYAKALHYKELEYFSGNSTAIIEDLIMINTQLQQQDAAWGMLIMARDQYDTTHHEVWYERLGRWQEAEEAYRKRRRDHPESSDAEFGLMRCYHALGEWENLSASVNENWANANNEQRRDMASWGAAAAWALHEWDCMDDYIASMSNDSPDRPFYKAILSVHRNQCS